MTEPVVTATPDQQGWLVARTEGAKVWVPGIHMVRIAAQELMRDVRRRSQAPREVRVVLEFHSDEGTLTTNPEQFDELVAWLYDRDAYIPVLTEAWQGTQRQIEAG